MKKKIYQKFYNRFMPLISVEEWYEGEHEVLPRFLNSNVYFNVLFIHTLGKGTDVYYDQSGSGVEELINYFKNNPNKIKKMNEEYEKYADEIIDFCKRAKFDNISELRNIVVKKIWPIITISVVLGTYSNQYGLKNLEKAGIQLRKKSDTLIYDAALKLYELTKEKFPKLIWYLDFLTFNEIESESLPSINELKKREQGYIYYKGKLYVGKSIDKFTKENNIELIDETAEFKDNEIKGTTAMTGKIIGRVKIVFEIPQMKNVKKGDILVASMTVPDFLPAMERAAAFVTDEGGITCHAAIVAREMKKPCIIGTKIATRVLKNGDLVEVDADNGIVRKV